MQTVTKVQVITPLQNTIILQAEHHLNLVCKFAQCYVKITSSKVAELNVKRTVEKQYAFHYGYGWLIKVSLVKLQLLKNLSVINCQSSQLFYPKYSPPKKFSFLSFPTWRCALHNVFSPKKVFFPKCSALNLRSSQSVLPSKSVLLKVFSHQKVFSSKCSPLK